MLKDGETYQDGCLCGGIRYRVQGLSLFETQCCCRDCQLATGTGHTYASAAPVPAGRRRVAGVRGSFGTYLLTATLA